MYNKNKICYWGMAMSNTTKESPHERFKRLASKRTNEVLKKLRILGNCSNRNLYTYSDEDVDKIFNAIDRQGREIKAKFRMTKKINFKL